MIVSGTTVSTVHVRVACDASTLPAASTAATRKGWLPWLRPVNVCGGAHGSRSTLSRPQTNASGLSVEVNEVIAGVLAVAPLGPAVIVVSGATVSTVHVRLAGVASGFPRLSNARTWNVCEP